LIEDTLDGAFDGTSLGVEEGLSDIDSKFEGTLLGFRDGRVEPEGSTH
jgi:hypothetical protein